LNVRTSLTFEEKFGINLSLTRIKYWIQA
jgi:hypothetical protein